MRKKKTYAMKRGGGVKPRMMKKGGAVKKMMKKGGAVKRMMKKGGAVKKFKPGGKVTASPAKMAGAAMGAGAAGMMAGMTVAKAKKFLAGKGFNVTKKTKGPR